MHESLRLSEQNPSEGLDKPTILDYLAYSYYMVSVIFFGLDYNWMYDVIMIIIQLWLLYDYDY